MRKRAFTKYASIKFGIPPTTIHDWMKKESSFLNLPSNVLNKKKLDTVKGILYQEVEIKLINFIEFNRKCLNPINTLSLLLNYMLLFLKGKNYQ